MRLLLKQFGRIREADLDIRPLTVFVGDNGTNKSWAAYALHGLLRTMSRQPSSYRIRDTSAQSELRDAVESQLQAGVDSSPVPSVIRVAMTYSDPSEVTLLASALADILGMDRDRLASSATAELSFTHDELRQSAVSLTLQYDRATRTMNAAGRSQDGQSYAWRVVGVTDAAELSAIIEQYATSTVDRVLLLPAERKAFTGVAGFDRALDVMRAVPAGRIPLAWVDLADALREAMGAHATDGRFPEIANYFKSLTGGVVKADDNGVNFQVKDGPTLPMHGAASLVRAVAGLDLYLSRLARKGDVVIIDELEMNAHPSAQLALVELVAMIVQAGVRVVFTTHSPYIVDHLNNLMAAASVPAAAQPGLVEQFALKSAQAFIAPELVAAYRFQGQDDGSVAVLDVLNRDRARIGWTTFTEVSDRLSTLWDLVDEAKSQPALVAKPTTKENRKKAARAA